MMKTEIITVESETGRIDSFIATKCELSRSTVSKLIEDGNVSLNGKTVKKCGKIKQGDIIEVTIPSAKPLEVLSQDIPLDILYEDDDLLVVNKPKGMVVHPAPGNPDGTLVNALLNHCKDSLSGINGVMRPGILHRIDKDTSGLLMVAKNDNAHKKLALQISEHTFTREYRAVVYGNVKSDKGRINLPIGRHPIKRKQMAVTDKNSKEAITNYEVIERFGNFTYMKFILETGRTHQIRVHSAHIGHAIAGDSVYGPKKVIKELGGQCLHAIKVGFVHPTTEKYMEFESELPEYFSRFLEKCKKESQ